MKYDRGDYTVFKGEEITIDIRPSSSLGRGQIVAGMDDGQTLTQPISFTVTRDTGLVHQVAIVYYFTDAPNGEYTITITGDAPNSETIVRKVRAPLPKLNANINYFFYVIDRP